MIILLIIYVYATSDKSCREETPTVSLQFNSVGYETVAEIWGVDGNPSKTFHFTPLMPENPNTLTYQQDLEKTRLFLKARTDFLAIIRKVERVLGHVYYSEESFEEILGYKHGIGILINLNDLNEVKISTLKIFQEAKSFWLSDNPNLIHLTKYLVSFNDSFNDFYEILLELAKTNLFEIK